MPVDLQQAAGENYHFTFARTPDGVKGPDGQFLRPECKYNIYEGIVDRIQQDTGFCDLNAPAFTPHNHRQAYTEINQPFIDQGRDSQGRGKGSTAGMLSLTDGVVLPSNVADAETHAYIFDPKTSMFVDIIKMSVDHVASLPSEQERVKQAGGKIFIIDQPGGMARLANPTAEGYDRYQHMDVVPSRIYDTNNNIIDNPALAGSTMTTRGFGDVEITGMTSDPEIGEPIDLNPYFEKGYWVLLTTESDGVFDIGKDRDKNEYIKARNELIRQAFINKKFDTLAQDLVRLAIYWGSVDNITSFALVMTGKPGQNMVFVVFDGHGELGATASAQCRQGMSAYIQKLRALQLSALQPEPAAVLGSAPQALMVNGLPLAGPAAVPQTSHAMSFHAPGSDAGSVSAPLSPPAEHSVPVAPPLGPLGTIPQTAGPDTIGACGVHPAYKEFEWPDDVTPVPIENGVINVGWGFLAPDQYIDMMRNRQSSLPPPDTDAINAYVDSFLRSSVPDPHPKDGEFCVGLYIKTPKGRILANVEQEAVILKRLHELGYQTAHATHSGLGGGKEPSYIIRISGVEAVAFWKQYHSDKPLPQIAQDFIDGKTAAGQSADVAPLAFVPAQHCIPAGGGIVSDLQENKEYKLAPFAPVPVPEPCPGAPQGLIKGEPKPEIKLSVVYPESAHHGAALTLPLASGVPLSFFVEPSAAVTGMRQDKPAPMHIEFKQSMPGHDICHGEPRGLLSAGSVTSSFEPVSSPTADSKTVEITFLEAAPVQRVPVFTMGVPDLASATQCVEIDVHAAGSDLKSHPVLIAPVEFETGVPANPRHEAPAATGVLQGSEKLFSLQPSEIRDAEQEKPQGGDNQTLQVQRAVLPASQHIPDPQFDAPLVPEVVVTPEPKRAIGKTNSAFAKMLYRAEHPELERPWYQQHKKGIIGSGIAAVVLVGAWLLPDVFRRAADQKPATPVAVTNPPVAGKGVPQQKKESAPTKKGDGNKVKDYSNLERALEEALKPEQ